MPEFHRDYELVTVELNRQGIFRYFTFYKKKNAMLKDMSQMAGNLK